MTITNTSHAQAVSPRSSASLPGYTLASVLISIKGSDKLADRQRQDLCSAVRTVGRALGTPLDMLPAHPGLLRDRLRNVTPALVNISPRRWVNAISLTRQAIRLTGITVAPGRSPVPFAPGWTALFRLIGAKHASIALSRLARYCTTHDIKPEDVSDAVFAAFLDELDTTDMRQSPRKVHRQAAVTWNRMVDANPTWPRQCVTIPSYSKVYALPWSRFPASLKLDLDAYLAHLAAGSDILDQTAFKPLRPASVRAVRCQLAAYIAGLVYRGCDPQSFSTLADVVALPVFKEGLRFILDRTPNSTKQAHGIGLSVRGMARHWVKIDEPHVEAMTAICKRLDTAPVGLAERNRDRLRQFDDSAKRDRLLALPEMLARKAARCKRPSSTEALWVQTALAIEILLMVPLRRRNLVRLNLDRHIRRTGRDIVHLVIPGEEVKNGTEIASVLPASVVDLLDLYLARYRPQLLSQPSPWLFPGVADRPKSLERMSLQITNTVERETGLQVNVHLFRHITAKLFLDANPGAYGVVRLLHGHKSVNTTTRYYCGAETEAAFQVYDQQIATLRENASRVLPAYKLSKPTAGRSIRR